MQGEEHLETDIIDDEDDEDDEEEYYQNCANEDGDSNQRNAHGDDEDAGQHLGANNRRLKINKINILTS